MPAPTAAGDRALALDAATPVDRLHALLHRFPVSAKLFHSGPLCGINDFADNGFGQLHLVRRGPLEVRHACVVHRVDEPTLLFYPRPLPHRFISDARDGADMACANLDFGGGGRGADPISRALPTFVALPLRELPHAAPLLDLLFDEAFARRCGRQVLVDRLFDAVVVLLLRHLLDHGRVHGGLLAGLAHPQLRKALAAMHDAPAAKWTVASMAATAGMSRSRFAEAFVATVGQAPADYLTEYRLTLAEQALRKGLPLARIADEVGYGSAATLSRAFAAVHGVAPREWTRRQEPGTRN